MHAAIGVMALMLVGVGALAGFLAYRRGDYREMAVYVAMAVSGYGILMVGAALRKKPVAQAQAAAAPEDPRGTPAQQALFVVRGQASVQAKLRDPGSAIFRDHFFSYSGGMHITCGRVNSKNGFGGYSGFQRYISNTLPETTWLEHEVVDFDAAWQRLCRG